MKAALCFSGRATKDSGFCIDNLNRYFIEPLYKLGYDVNVFAHLWEIDDWENALDLLNCTHYITEPDKSEQLREEFEARIFARHEDRIRELNPNVWKGKMFWYPYTPNMFYSIMKANNLKIEQENALEFTYDLVARMRTDNVSQEGSYADELAKVVDCPRNTLWVPTDYVAGTCPPVDPVFDYVVDNFAIGGSEALDNYAETFCEIEEFIALGLEKYQPHNWPKEKLKGAYWLCGTMLGTTLKKHGVAVKGDLAPGLTILRKLRNRTKAADKGKMAMPKCGPEWLTYLDERED
jgi:hypothetical protein